MIARISLLIFLLSYFQQSQINNLQTIVSDSLQVLEQEISQVLNKLTLSMVKTKIEDFQSNAKNCLDNQFQTLQAQDVGSAISECLGENYSIFNQTFRDINYTLNEFTKEQIKISLNEEFCPNHIEECLYFFEVVQLFIDMNFDVQQSLNINRAELEKKILPQNLSLLIQALEDKIQEYNNARESMFKMREYFSQYLQDNLNTMNSIAVKI